MILKDSIIEREVKKFKAMEIEINGVKYQQIKEETPKHNYSKSSKSLMMMSMFMMPMMDNYGWGGGRKEKETPNVDIIKEYGLIQQKKSYLSKSQRDWVVKQFEKNFERVPS